LVFPLTNAWESKALLPEFMPEKLPEAVSSVFVPRSLMPF
jgi:hypothetical protein